MVFKHDISSCKKIGIIFTCIMLGFMLLGLCLYPLYYSFKDSLYTWFSSLPEETLLAFGINLDNFQSIMSYYSFLMTVILIIAALFASYLGFYLILTDRKNNAASFYELKPINDAQIIKQKLAAGITILLCSVIIYHIISTILILIFKNDAVNIWVIFQMNSSIFLLELVFYLVGMIVAFFVKKSRTFIIPSVIIIIIFGALNLVERGFKLKFLKYINPFSYFNITDIINQGKYQYRFIIITAFIVFFLYFFITGLYESQQEKTGN